MTLPSPISDPAPTQLPFLRFQNLFVTLRTLKFTPTDAGGFLLLKKIFSIMSKGNMLLGHARGKVGSLVFSRSNGTQVVRARAEVVKNPRTRAQLIQRIVMNTTAQAYSLMGAILDHSFEGIAKGQASMSFFSSRTNKMLREKVANAANLGLVQSFSPIGTNIFALNEYEISKGKLPVVDCSYVYDDAQTTGTGSMPLTSNTYQGVLDKYGLQRGDQLTFVVVHVSAAGVATFDFARVILDPRNSDGSEAALSSAFVSANGINLPSPKNEGTFTAISFAANAVSFRLGAQDNLYGVGIIVSRKGTDGAWLRSNATLKVASIEDAEFGFTMQDALDRAVQGSVDVESPYYLNNAGVSNTATTTDGGNSGGGNDDMPGAGGGGEG